MFPCRSEPAKEVIKILIHEIIPRFGLPRSLQSDNGSAFKAAVTQGVSKALGIEYHLHCSWRPQPSGKVENINHGSRPGLYKDVSCLRTIFGLNLLANSVILKCKLWEWVW